MGRCRRGGWRGGAVGGRRAAERGRHTLLLEKNRQPGVKILMSGGTRCNLTHATDARGIIDAYGPPGRFLHSALAALSPADLVALIEAEGVPTKTEPNGKIFPASDKASDVLDALLRRLRRSGCTLREAEPVVELRPHDSGFCLVTVRGEHHAEKVILTTGGRSYPGSGATGDGYAWAAALGHTIMPLRPALTPVRTDERWVKPLRGVTLPDIVLEVVSPESRKPLAARREAMLFTHFGFSGPAVLDVSRAISGHPRPETLRLVCDLLPDVSLEQLDEQLRSQCESAGKKHLPTLLTPALPQRLAQTIVELAGLSPSAKLAELTKPQRRRLAGMVKRLEIPITGTLGFRKAEVTAGGVRLSEVDSSSMQSKVAPNLFLAGEILDLDGPIGGYNFQAAFSTGWLAGESV